MKTKIGQRYVIYAWEKRESGIGGTPTRIASLDHENDAFEIFLTSFPGRKLLMDDHEIGVRWLRSRTGKITSRHRFTSHGKADAQMHILESIQGAA